MIWDMKDLTDPVLNKEWIGTTHATDHNQFVKGNRLYQSNYRAGLRILDIYGSESTLARGGVPYRHVSARSNSKDGGGSWGNFPWFKNGLIGVVSDDEGFFLVRDKTKPIVP